MSAGTIDPAYMQAAKELADFVNVPVAKIWVASEHLVGKVTPEQYKDILWGVFLRVIRGY